MGVPAGIVHVITSTRVYPQAGTWANCGVRVMALAPLKTMYAVSYEAGTVGGSTPVMMQ